jgi:hypothetical protein
MALATDSVWQLFLFSGIGSVTAELATVPIDVVKTRMQLQEGGGALGGAAQPHAPATPHSPRHWF